MNILAQRLYGITTNYVLISVPLFIFMATLLERSGIAKDMYSSLSQWMSRTRGGIAVVTAIMAIVMAAMSGIIGGEVVLLGLIALPQMLRLGYNQNLAIGTICASGSLGTMIPPSIVLIFYGLITETSIHALFKAAFLPGFMLAGCYIIYILVRTRMNPELAPLPDPSPDDMTGKEKALYGSTLCILLAGVGSALIVARWLYLTIGNQFNANMIDGNTRLIDNATLIQISVDCQCCAAFIYFVVGISVAKDALGQGQGNGRAHGGGVRRAWVDLWRHHRHHRSCRHGVARGVVPDLGPRRVFNQPVARSLHAHLQVHRYHHLGDIWRHRPCRCLHHCRRPDLCRQPHRRLRPADHGRAAGDDGDLPVPRARSWTGPALCCW